MRSIGKFLRVPPQLCGRIPYEHRPLTLFLLCIRPSPVACVPTTDLEGLTLGGRASAREETASLFSSISNSRTFSRFFKLFKLLSCITQSTGWPSRRWLTGCDSTSREAGNFPVAHANAVRRPPRFCVVIEWPYAARPHRAPPTSAPFLCLLPPKNLPK